MLGEIVGSDDLGAPSMVLSEYGNIIKEQIDKIKSYYDVEIDKYVIMPNHIHMIIVVNRGAPRSSRPTNALIPNIITALKKMINKKIEFKIWQTSYHDHIIRNESEYQKIWQYIDTNPEKWKDDCYTTV